ncbi:MAG: amino acid ABC transporter permease [Clostridia bacterium]|nr:amino acid ABC transporter permease [Clostridia bacterium]
MDFKKQFILNFVEDSRWKYLTNGLKNTLIITIFALLIGIVIGIIVSMIRSTFDKTAEDVKKKNIVAYIFFWTVNALCKVYLTVIRGTPVVVQLMIAYFIIFVSSNNGIMVAAIAFGINSGAYVAEILRGGIMSIDQGQFEASRSLGFNYIQTMAYVIIPQVFKTVLPTLLNEFIALIKETSIAGYVGIMDLTKGGDIIRGRTFSAYMPLFAVAIIYLVIVMFLTYVVGKVERRLRKNER